MNILPEFFRSDRLRSAQRSQPPFHENIPQKIGEGKGKRFLWMMQTEWRRESLIIARTLKDHAEARGITAGQFSTAWVLNNRLVTSVIAGPRVEAQLNDYLGALKYRFTAEDEALVNSFVAPGHASTPGYTDPMEPVEGRVPR